MAKEKIEELWKVYRKSMIPKKLSPKLVKELKQAFFAGESGPGARPMDAQWVREIRDNCLQSGGVFKQRTGRMLDGRTWDQVAPGRFFKSRLTGPQISSKSFLRIFTISSSSSFVSTMKGRGGIVTFLLRPAFPPN